jgi:hypothetical protein
MGGVPVSKNDNPGNGSFGSGSRNSNESLYQVLLIMTYAPIRPIEALAFAAPAADAALRLARKGVTDVQRFASFCTRARAFGNCAS